MNSRLKALYLVKLLQIIISCALVLNLIIFDKYQYNDSFVLYIPDDLMFLPFLEAGLFFSSLIVEAIIGSFPLGKLLAFIFLDIVSFLSYITNTSLNIYFVFTTMSISSFILVLVSVMSLLAKPIGKKFNNGASLPRMIYSKKQLKNKNIVICLWSFVSLLMPVVIIILLPDNNLPIIFFVFMYVFGYYLITIKYDDVIQSVIIFRKTGSIENYCGRLNQILHNDLEKDTQIYVKSMLLQMYSYYDNIDAKNKLSELDEPNFKRLNNAYHASCAIININCGMYDEAEENLSKITKKTVKTKVRNILDIYKTKNTIDLKFLPIIDKYKGVSVISCYHIMNYYYLRDDLEASKSYASKLLSYNTDLSFINEEARKILESTNINYS